MGSGKSLSPGALGMVVTFVILALAADLRADDRQLLPKGDEGYDILSKLSGSSSHHMMHIDGSDARRFVAAVSGTELRRTRRCGWQVRESAR
jgi:hypothetical protein